MTIRKERTMPSKYCRLVAGLALALAGLAHPARAQDQAPAATSLTTTQAAGPESPLNRSTVEEIVRRTLAASCCQDCCCPAAPCYCWEGAFEVTFLQPRFDNFGNGTVRSSINDPNVSADTLAEPQFELEAGWRLWLS